MTSGDVETPELRSIAERAQRRQNRWLLRILLIGTVAGVLGGLAASRFGQHHHHGHRHSTLGLIAALVVAAVILAGEGALGFWLVRRRKGIFQAALVAGLPWRDRRVVAKAVRRGRPPSDALLRRVGLNFAERMLRYRQYARASYLILVLLQTVNALLPDRPSWFRYVCAATAVLFLWGLLYHRAVIAGARRYLERCGG